MVQKRGLAPKPPAAPRRAASRPGPSQYDCHGRLTSSSSVRSSGTASTDTASDRSTPPPSSADTTRSESPTRSRRGGTASRVLVSARFRKLLPSELHRAKNPHGSAGWSGSTATNKTPKGVRDGPGVSATAACHSISVDGTSVAIIEPERGINRPAINHGEWQYDRVFSEAVTQAEVYACCGAPLVDWALQGFSCTLLAYGQTGSGKTYSMVGDPKDEVTRGMLPRIIRDLYLSVQAKRVENEGLMTYSIRAAYLELYLDTIADLLNPDSATPLRIREDPARGIFVDGLYEVECGTQEECYELMIFGSGNRATAETKMNADSSRSHAIFIIFVESTDVATEGKKLGQMYLVDLAGSEMVNKTGAQGTTLSEAKMINKSLSALGKVIKALVQKKSHIPYRDSKLTRILMHSLGGNAKTSLLVTCSPCKTNIMETMSTLRFGAQSRKVTNRAVVNHDRTKADYEHELGAAQRAESELRDALAASAAELKELKSGSNPKAAEDEAARAASATMKAVIDAKDHQLQLLAGDRDKHSSRLQEREVELAGVTAARDAHGRRVGEQEKALQLALAHNKELMSQVDALRDEVASTKAVLSTVQRDLRTQREEVSTALAGKREAEARADSARKKAAAAAAAAAVPAINTSDVARQLLGGGAPGSAGPESARSFRSDLEAAVAAQISPIAKLVAERWSIDQQGAATQRMPAVPTAAAPAAAAPGPTTPKGKSARAVGVDVAPPSPIVSGGGRFAPASERDEVRASSPT